MTTGSGLIGVFARHPTAANLLMILMIIGGLFSWSRLNTQFFPEFGLDWIQISVEWPGASAEDVDANIVQAIEPEVRFLDGVKRVNSTSVEGLGTVFVEFEPGTDMQAALADVETAVDQVTTLPEEREQPVIKRIVRYDNITRLVISGPYPEAALKAFAKRIREDLLARGIDKVDLIGARDEEIWVEVDPETLRRLDFTLGDIAERIAETSRDLPLGDTRGDAKKQIRSLGLVKTARELGRVEVRSLPGGEKIYLRDIAAVSERFEDGGVTVRRGALPAVELHVQRALNADALELADTVVAYLDEQRPTLPPNLRIEQYDVAAELIRSRIDLLLRNGLSGLVLVVTMTLSDVINNAATATDQVVGQVARYPVEIGEQFGRLQLVQPGEVQALSFQIPQGLRAFTIPVSVNNTPASLMAPGDFIDILVSGSPEILQQTPQLALVGGNYANAR
ncbi:MAG: efflux RND transporter permease subunit, partial [Proteobacteria bacterium]|nr:efflux RND transporter permease subunit [Pseudomonadota bacterium]